ncbi:MAG: DUF1579 domain-containing protein [Planctomycetota bacterium]
MSQDMAQYMAMIQPGEHHRRLEPLAGKFRAAVKFWMAPDVPPSESAGTIENTWVLGGRFLLSRYAGQTMGQPFEGLGLMGYDNFKQQYVALWADSMGTFLMPVGSGNADATGRAISIHRACPHPVTGQPFKTRDVTTIHSRDSHGYVQYQTGADGVERKALEIVYTRL